MQLFKSFGFMNLFSGKLNIHGMKKKQKMNCLFREIGGSSMSELHINEMTELYKNDGHDISLLTASSEREKTHVASSTMR